jgi:molecular chaperone DnaJ
VAAPISVIWATFSKRSGSGAFGGGRQQARRGADLRCDMEGTLEEAFHGKTAEISSRFRRSDPCDGSGAEPGTGARRCNLCGGHGRRAQQGFFMVERTCPTRHGRGEVIEKPCRFCRGEGRVDLEQTLEVTISPASTTARASALPARARLAVRCPPGDLYIFLHVAPPRVRTRRHHAADARADQLHDGGAGRRDRDPGLDGKRHAVEIRRHPVGQLRKRCGHARAQGRGMGDLVVEVMVETPTRLSARQKNCCGSSDRDRRECPQSKGPSNGSRKRGAT